MKLLPIIFIAFWRMLCFVHSADAEDSVLLRYRLLRGDAFTVNSHLSADLSYSIEKETRTSKIVWDSRLLCRVHEVSDSGDLTLNIVFEHIVLNIRSPDMVLTHDTRDSTLTTDVLLCVLDVMTSQTLSTTLTAQGEILGIEGFEEITQETIKRLGMDDSPRVSNIRDAINLLFGDKYKQALTSCITRFPEDPLTPGDSWESMQELTIISPVQFNTTSILTVLEGNEALLTTRVDFNSLEDSLPVTTDGIGLAMNIKGRMWGSRRVDTNTGLVRFSSQSYELKGTMKGIFGNETEIIMPLTYKANIMGNMERIEE